MFVSGVPFNRFVPFCGTPNEAENGCRYYRARSVKDIRLGRGCQRKTGYYHVRSTFVGINRVFTCFFSMIASWFVVRM